MTSDFNVILDVSSRISSKSILKISFMGTLISRLVISRGMRFQLRRLSIKPSTLRKRPSLLTYCGAHHRQLRTSYSALTIEPYSPQTLSNTTSAPTSTRRGKMILRKPCPFVKINSPKCQSVCRSQLKMSRVQLITLYPNDIPLQRRIDHGAERGVS